MQQRFKELKKQPYCPRVKAGGAFDYVLLEWY